MKQAILKISGVVLASVLLMLAQAQAAPQSIPNGPWIQDDQTVKLEALTSMEELQKKLFDIYARSKGRMQVEIAGETTSGLPLYLVKFGEPDPDKIRVLIEGQIHGGEPLGVEACIEVIKQLAASGNPDIDMIRDNLTIWLIPRMNPEGATYEVDGEVVQRRQNSQPWTPEEWGLPPDAPAPWYYRSRTPPGYDINRDSNPDLDFELGPANAYLLPGESALPGFFVTPEARTVRDAYKELQPDVFIDLHHRGTNLVSEEDISMCTLQILAQVVDLGREDYPLDPAVLNFSKQINAYVYQRLLEMGNSPFTGVQRYPDVNLPGTTLGTFTLNGSAIMLYEVRTARQKSSGMLTKQVIIGLMETLKGLADESIYDVDPADYDEIPPAGPRIGNPHLFFE
ncbi:MAG: hypothetical protein JSW39_11250 [Desulfobacterales bacterium]|nr:MAG: hypothetical protein JSW39_11250 [Desulfobacterales bacterium]